MHFREGAHLFERPHHQRIARVLEAIDPSILDDNGCLFGGGTAIALAFGEYRESVDIDFLISDLGGYRRLRSLVTGDAGLRGLVRPGFILEQRREVRADQYGLRTVVAVDGVEIKLEIVLEARIALSPSPTRMCGVTRLADVDLVASKLLANADRYNDDSVFSRDIIDLAMMRTKPAVWDAGREKAQRAYGDAIDRDLLAAIERLHVRPGRLLQCMQALAMTTTLPSASPITPAQLWSRIRVFGASPKT